MALIDLTPEAVRVPEKKIDLLDRFEFAIDDQLFLADIAKSGDFRIDEARKIEVDTFEILGDIPDEVIEEFDPHDESSVFIFLYDAIECEAGHPEKSKMLGMVRLIPYNSDTGGLKTFVDLGKIASADNSEGQLREGEDSNLDTREKILLSLGLDRAQLSVGLDAEQRAQIINYMVEQKFMQEFGIDDLSTLIDIATLAPDMNLDFDLKLKVIDGLLSAMGVYATDLYEKGELTHLVQFTAGALHHYLRDLYGYPVIELFGLEDLSYDSFGNGGDDNMVSTPSVLVYEQLSEEFLFTDNPITEHLGVVGSAISQVRSTR